MPAWENRITRYDPAVDPADLLANPRNARRHGGAQREVIRTVLDDVGVVAPLLVNETTGYVIDGHMRAEEAITAGAKVPVLYVALSEAEEVEVLATFDASGYLATYDRDVFADLLADLDATGLAANDDLTRLLADIAATAQNDTTFAPPTFAPALNPNADPYRPADYDKGAAALDSQFDPPTSDRKQVICPKCFEEFHV